MMLNINSKLTNRHRLALALVKHREAQARTFGLDYLAEHTALLRGWNLAEAVRNNKGLADLLGAAGTADYECRRLLAARPAGTSWPELRRRLLRAAALYDHAAMLCTFCGWLREERDAWEDRQQGERLAAAAA